MVVTCTEILKTVSPHLGFCKVWSFSVVMFWKTALPPTSECIDAEVIEGMECVSYIGWFEGVKAVTAVEVVQRQ